MALNKQIKNVIGNSMNDLLVLVFCLQEMIKLISSKVKALFISTSVEGVLLNVDTLLNT